MNGAPHTDLDEAEPAVDPDETSLPWPEDDDPGDRHERRRNRRVLLVALVLLLVPALAVGGYLGWLNHIVTANVKQATLLPDSSLPDANGAAAPQNLATKGTNYLIIGNDAGPGRSGARSDVMVLAHVPADHSAVTLIHFPRDLWVPIPGHGTAKLNASYAYGGSPLLVTTMQQMLGVHIDHVAMLGFEGFKAMTDAVGGVDVNVAEPSESSDGHVFTRGLMHMDGATALAFVRQRKELSEGDISRGRRQLAFIKALMLKTLSSSTLTNPVTIKDFLDAATTNLTVDQNLDAGAMRSEAFSLRGLRGGDIRFITAPFTGFGTSSDGQSIDIVDVSRMKELGQAIARDDLAGYR